MKVALLLSGLARNVSDGYNLYYKHIIEKYNVDVYCHYWKDGEYDKVLEFYKPVKYVCDNPFPFTEYKYDVESPGDPFARPIFPYDVAGNFTSLPMFYGWQRVYNLLDREYDCIIKSRYDLAGEFIPNLSNMDLTKINTSAYHWPNSEILDDNLLIMDNKLADCLFKNIFDELVIMIKDDKKINFSEKNFTNLVIKKNLYIFVHKSQELPFRLLREFKVWY